MKDRTMIASWSGGKDSCLACYTAIRQGMRIVYLLNCVSKEYNRCCFHGIPADLLKLQAEAVGIPVYQQAVTADMQEYEKEFKEAVTALKTPEISGMVFGDIYLDEHRDWVERVCGDVGLKAVEPLWGRPAGEVAREFVDLGFKTVIVSCKSDILGKEFIGRVIDHDLILQLEDRGICPCGENGEFHTFVIDGPLFKRKIEIVKAEPLLKDGFWRHWFLDIKEWA